MAEEAVKVFLDSNVILFGFLSDKGAPRIILDLLSLDLPFLSGLTGQYNIIEIKWNLKNKLPEALPVYKEYFPKLGLEIISLPSKEEIKDYKDIISEKDVPVLASAIKGEADYLVTGDKDFIKVENKGRFSFKIVTPQEFLEIQGGKAAKWKIVNR